MGKAGRFTAWLSAPERRALESVARDEEATEAFIVRKAVRKYVGNKALLKAAAELNTEAQTLVTGNSE